MAATSVVARVRELLERAAQGLVETSEIAARADDLVTVKARLARLKELGLGDAVEIAPEVDALLARVAPVAAAA